MSDKTTDMLSEALTSDMDGGQWSIPSIRTQISAVVLGHQIGVFPLAVLLSVVLCAVNLWGLNTSIIGLFHDDGIYTVLAKSLSEGSGYSLISLPSAPTQTKYPFVYPYLLSWVWQLNPSFPDNIFLLKAVNVGFLFVALLLSYVLYCRSVAKSGLDVLSYLFLVGGNLLVFSLGDFPLSELLFLVCTLSAFLLCGFRAYPTSTQGRVALLAVVVALTYLTRTAGAPFILAGILYFLTTHRYRELLLFVCILAVFLCPWLLWQFSHTSPSSLPALFGYYVSYDYKGDLVFFSAWSHPLQTLQVVWANLRYLVESFDVCFLITIVPWLRLPLYVLFVWGIYVAFHRYTVFFYTFLLSYLLLVIGWLWHPLRFVVPLVPLFFLFSFIGMQAAESALAARVASPQAKRAIGALVRLPLLILVVLNLLWLSFYLQNDDSKTTRAWAGRQLPYAWSGFVETFSWINEHTQEEDVLATAYDPMYYLYTGRKAIRPWFYKPETYFYPYNHPVPNLGSAQKIREELSTIGVRYLIVDPLDGYVEQEAGAEFFAELLHSYPTPPELVFKSSDGLHEIYALPDLSDSRHHD